MSLQTIPTDVRDLRAGDRVQLCSHLHRVHRVRQVRLGCPTWRPAHDLDGNRLYQPATEILHALLAEPNELICTAIPHGAKILVIIPI